MVTEELTRKSFISKALLASLGAGSLALLFGSSGGLGSETDPLAVLRNPTGTQSILPTASGFDPAIEGRILSFLDPSANSGIVRGFSVNSDLAIGIPPQFRLLRQSNDNAQSMFMIKSVDTGFLQAVLTVDPVNQFGFGNDAIVLGDDGSIDGTPTTVVGVLAGAGGLDLTHVLLVPLGTPGLCSIAGGAAGIAKGVTRSDHTHAVGTSSLGTPAAIALIGARGSSNVLPRFDHAHKGIVWISDGRQTGQTAAIASLLSFTVGAADGLFRIQGNVNITAFVAGTFNMTVTYTDETNTSRTLTLNFSSLTGTLGIALAAAGPFEGIPSVIRVKASTAITVATSGTFTSLTYNAEVMLEQLA